MSHGSGDAQRVSPTRVSRAWVHVLPAIAILAVTLLFVLQNLRITTVTFVTASGRLPLGAALVAAAALGGLLVFALGSIRIVQLRKAIRRSPGRRHSSRPVEAS